MRILVIGESCKDIFVYGKCERLCPEAPAPVLNPLFTTENGGMAMNVVKNIISLGAECDVYTNDDWNEVTKTRYIDHNFNHMFLRVDAKDKIKRIEHLQTIQYSSYDAIIISDYNKGFLQPEDIDSIAKNHDLVFLDTKKILEERWCQDINFIKINNYEYNKTKYTITKEMLDKTIITKGSEGCVFREKTYPVDKVEIKDSSGAGDTFVSALVVKYIETGDMDHSISYANKCSTEVVQKRGVATVGNVQ
tara:strand:+ start:1652 stop:2398 length:747 start_codon:yes stop_codon:yes gene_type:complete